VKLINLTRATLKRVKCRIKLQGHLSEPFLTQRGLRQGDALAYLLFNIALDKVLRDSFVIYYKSVQVLAYANDLYITGRSEKDVKEAFIKLNNEKLKMGFNINEEKIKYIEITAKPTKNKYINVGNCRFEKGDLGLVEYLVDRGADVSIPNNTRNTPLHWIHSHHWEILASHLISLLLFRSLLCHYSVGGAFFQLSHTSVSRAIFVLSAKVFPLLLPVSSILLSNIILCLPICFLPST
jgi:hypothetical protein